MEKQMTFMEMVRHEVEQLEIHLTGVQKGRLDKGTFNPSVYTRCIYGQITGDCFSPAAGQLIMDCAVGLTRKDIGATHHSYYDRPTIKRLDGNAWLTPLENYIIVTKNHNILEYLKGEADTLELTDIEP